MSKTCRRAAEPPTEDPRGNTPTYIDPAPWGSCPEDAAHSSAPEDPPWAPDAFAAQAGALRSVPPSEWPADFVLELVRRVRAIEVPSDDHPQDHRKTGR